MMMIRFRNLRSLYNNEGVGFNQNIFSDYFISVLLCTSSHAECVVNRHVMTYEFDALG